MKVPVGIDERLEQYRPAIVKAEGLTQSERYLAKLAERSFLNLWSYPNPYRDQKVGGKGIGKELCDLLVVCGDHIIIFSEKTIGWTNGDTCTAWNRWSKAAIRGALKQLKGAERWIRDFPDRIFLDPECKQEFPIALPNHGQAKLHRIIVARGASEACREFHAEKSGSLVLDPTLRAGDHWPKDPSLISPFVVGDLDPEQGFVHVFDEVSLDVVLGELDTIRDLTDYLDKKATFFRSGRMPVLTEERDLIAYYSVRVNRAGEHDFVPDHNNGFRQTAGAYERWVRNPQYQAKKDADKVSYVWDQLIELFTTHMLNGTSIVLEGYDFQLKRNEVAVRTMALARRFARRQYGEAVLEALDAGRRSDSFCRLIMSGEVSEDNDTAFFIMTLKYLPAMDKSGGYENYRKLRTQRAEFYAKGILLRYPKLKRVVGVCREPPLQGGGVSEDIVYAEQHEWTAEDRVSIIEGCKVHGILQGQLVGKSMNGQEYPEVDTVKFTQPIRRKQGASMNRRERRAQLAKEKRLGKRQRR